MTDIEDLTALFDVVVDCCLHNPLFLPDDVEEVLVWAGDRQSMSESESTVLVRLKDHSYGLFTQSEDYTGHGCQCGSATFRDQRLGHLLSALENWQLEKLLTKVEELPDGVSEVTTRAETAPEFQPVERVDTLTHCARCSAVVPGDVAAQTLHRVWHDNVTQVLIDLEQRIQRAGSQLPTRYA